MKGSGGVQLSANIENAESNEDYNNLTWTSTGINGVDGNSIAKVMGSGKTVLIYPVSAGEVTIMAQLPDSDSVAKCTVLVEAGKSLSIESTSIKVMPHQTKRIAYTVSPTNAVMTFVRQSDDEYFVYKDCGYDSKGNGFIEIEGVKEGSGMLLLSTDGGATARLTINCAYNFSCNVLGSTSFNIKPNEKVEFTYIACPPDARINIASGYLNTNFTANVEVTEKTEDNQRGKITLTPVKECKDKISIEVQALWGAEERVVARDYINGTIKYPGKLSVGISNVNKKKGSIDAWTGYAVSIEDGGEVSLEVYIAESKANGYISEIKYNNPRDGIKVTTNNTTDGKQAIIDASAIDYIVSEERYFIKNLWVDSRYTSMKDFRWQVFDKTIEHTFSSNEYADYLRLLYPGFPGTYDRDLEANCYLAYDDDDENGTDWIPAKEVTKNVPIMGWDSKGEYTEVGSETVTNMEFVETSRALEELTSYRNTWMSIDELKNNPWLWCPGTISKYQENVTFTWAQIVDGTYINGSYGRNDKVSVDPHIMRSHVDAELRTWYSDDNTIKWVEDAGYLTVTVVHNDSSESSNIQIPIRVYFKECKCK